MELTSCPHALSNLKASRDAKNRDLVRYECRVCHATAERHVPLDDYLAHRQHAARVEAALAR